MYPKRFAGQLLKNMGDKDQESKGYEAQDDIERNIAKGWDEIKNAFENESGFRENAMFCPAIGTNITFFLGWEGDRNRNYKGGVGLLHILAKHGEKIFARIPEVIAKGRIVDKPGEKRSKRSRVYIFYDGIGLSLDKEYRFRGGVWKTTWVVSAYEDVKTQKKESSVNGQR